MLATKSMLNYKNGNTSLSIEARHPLFEKMEKFPKKQYRKGEIIYTPEDNAREIFFIHDGRVKTVIYSAEGKELIKKFFIKGDFFGEGALLKQNKRHNFAVANTKVHLSVIPVTELWDLMQKDPSVNMFFLSLFSRQLVELENRLESIVFQSSRTRILGYLVNLIEEKGDRVGFEWVIRRFMSHQDIANITATSRQTVNAVLNELRRDGVITFNRRRLLVRDLDRLKNVAREALKENG
jgi:CRP-like cAMP-binding protein